jgi:hypothetical protein
MKESDTATKIPFKNISEPPISDVINKITVFDLLVSENLKNLRNKFAALLMYDVMLCGDMQNVNFIRCQTNLG